MEWLSTIRNAIDYIETHLKDNITIQDVSNHVYLSPIHLQKGFSIISGYSISEYIRNRKLYLAAIDLKNTNKKVLEIAYDYGYETPESFTKAFSRFHGVTPLQVRQGTSIKTFLPINLKLTRQGGDHMNITITKMFGLKFVGFAKEFSYETSYEEIPKFWDEIYEKYANPIYVGNQPLTPQQQAFMDYCIGEYGVCIDDAPDVSEGKFIYLVGGKYTGGEVPEGLSVYEFEQGEWAVFDCIGPIPEAFQALNSRIFQEWLPNNPDYELDRSANIEWYDCINGNSSDNDYHSAIWLPVKRKAK